MLTFHSDMLTFDLLVAFVAPDISVITVTFGHLFIAIVTEVI